MLDASRCFVCGPDNPIGLRLVFHDHADGIRGTFVPAPDHVGYQGIVHGGILAAVLDDALANVFTRDGRAALVGRLEVRFRQPARPGEALEVRARALDVRGRLALGAASLTRPDGVVVATAKATLMLDGDD